jgi:hypothetical protein
MPLGEGAHVLAASLQRCSAAVYVVETRAQLRFWARPRTSPCRAVTPFTWRPSMAVVRGIAWAAFVYWGVSHQCDGQAARPTVQTGTVARMGAVAGVAAVMARALGSTSASPREHVRAVVPCFSWLR